MLGSLPHEAERIFLLHLNGLCKALGDALEANVNLTLISDGIMYKGEMIRMWLGLLCLTFPSFHQVPRQGPGVQ